MEFNLTTILILLGALILGWVVGFFDANLRTSKKIKAAETQAQIQIEAARAMALSAEAQAKEQAIEATTGNNLLRLWTGPGQEVHLELDDQPADPHNLTPDQRRRLIALLASMRPWLEGGASAPVQPPPAAPEKPAAPASASSTPPTAKETSPAPPSASIVAQINDILQSKLIGTPLEKRGVRLQKSSSGGVMVFVGLKIYDGIDAVPDPEVQAIIRQAVAEWEKAPH
ncbi:MAG: hypothetical protein Q8N45_12735 [Anaerolineales bacterium]|nr:hypothetical protein [Anaerolineales bacterium]